MPRVGPDRMLSSKESQDRLNVKISAYRAQAAFGREGRNAGRPRRHHRSDEGSATPDYLIPISKESGYQDDLANDSKGSTPTPRQ